jgi:hypothetical protein
MRGRQVRRITSYLLIAGAGVCLFLGGREFLGSRFGQVKSAREFEAENQARESITPQPETRAQELFNKR